MRRFAIVAAGVILGLLVGALASYLFNVWYTPRFVKSDDDVSFLVALLLFGFLPVGALAGGVLGYRLSSARQQ